LTEKVASRVHRDVPADERAWHAPRERVCRAVRCALWGLHSRRRRVPRSRGVRV